MKIVKTLPAVLTLLVAASAPAQEYLISTIAGFGRQQTAATTAAPIAVNSVAVDTAGNIYFASGNSVFKMDETGVPKLVAGAPGISSIGDGGGQWSLG